MLCRTRALSPIRKAGRPRRRCPPPRLASIHSFVAPRSVILLVAIALRPRLGDHSPPRRCLSTSEGQGFFSRHRPFRRSKQPFIERNAEMPSENEIRQQISEQILNALKSGVKPWRRPWALDSCCGAPRKTRTTGPGKNGLSGVFPPVNSRKATAGAKCLLSLNAARGRVAGAQWDLHGA